MINTLITLVLNISEARHLRRSRSIHHMAYATSKRSLFYLVHLELHVALSGTDVDVAKRDVGEREAQCAVVVAGDDVRSSRRGRRQLAAPHDVALRVCNTALC